MVVALALAAVFGSMSLAPNPAQAQGTMADPIMMYVGLDSEPTTVFSTLPTGAAAVGASAYDPSGIIEGDVLYTAGNANRGKVTFTTASGVTNNNISLGGSLVKATFTSDNGTTSAPPDPPTSDDVTVELYIRVMRSEAAAPAEDADGMAVTIAAEELYTEFTTEDFDVGKAFETGTGTGKIIGYNVTGGTANSTPPETTDGFTITDEVTGTADGAAEANVGSDGTADLKAGADDVPSAVTLSVVPICETSTGNYGTCVDSVGTPLTPVTFDVTVADSTATRESGTPIPAVEVDKGASAMVMAADVMAAFTPGMGTGSKISEYRAVSTNPFLFYASGSPSGVITINGVNTGSALVTVTAIDGFDVNNNPSVSFAVTVVEPDAPLPMATSLNFMVDDTTAESAAMDEGEVTLSWTNPNDSRITGWQYSTDAGATWMDIPVPAGETAGSLNSHSITVDVGTTVSYQLRYMLSDGTMGGETVASTPFDVTVPVPPPPFLNTFKADDLEPGKNSWYTLNYKIDNEFNGGLHDMTIKLEGFGVPSSIGTSSIAMEVTEPNGDSYTFNPASVGIDGKSIIITIPDVAPEAEITKKSFAGGSTFRVILRQGSGITNPTLARTYGGLATWKDWNDEREIFVDFADSGAAPKTHLIAAGAPASPGIGVSVPRVVLLDETDGGLGDEVGVTGLGFENGGTLHFFLDKNGDGELGAGEDVLCSVPSVSGNMGSCAFTVSTPTFATGDNYVNAVDGDGKIASKHVTDDNTFELKASIKATPAGGSPGEIIQVQLVSFPAGQIIKEIKLSGEFICGGIPPGMTRSVSCSSLGYGSVGAQGTGSLGVPVPNWATAGVQELFVAAGDEDDDVKVTIVGPRIVPTPATVVANQRISLVGTGFSPRSVIGRVAPGQTQIARISIGGDDIEWPKVNNGRVVEVDDGGNWSASVDLPLSEATTGTGERTIRITDSMGRTGSMAVTLAARNFDITPPEGRVGTLAVVRGVGYPSKNDEGESFTVDVVYNVQEGTSTRVSVVPDASGRFEVQLRIPTTAAIPSTNQIEVRFNLEDGTPVLENKQHIVPEGIITLSDSSGGPGSTITVSGEGYKAFVNVDSVRIGNFDVTPAPKPHTNGNGMMEFDLLIPGIDVGIQTIEVQVGGTTSSVGFTVTESGVNPGDIQPVAKSFEELGDNLVSVWHFNNDTKVWSFYDPTLAEGNTLTHTITGEPYFIRIKANQEVILNRDTRSLTCVGGNCWNPIVW